MKKIYLVALFAITSILSIKAQVVFQEDISANFEGASNGSNIIFDLNNDSYLDIVTTGFTSSSQIKTRGYLNLGCGEYTQIQNNALTNRHVHNSAIAYSDVDGDNDLDVFITGKPPTGSSNVAELYLNDGNGNFFLSTGNVFEKINFSSVAFADVDGDNDQDLIISGSNNSNDEITNLYINDGFGIYTLKIGTPFEGVAGGQTIFSDIDGDNDQDVLLTGFDNNLNPLTNLYLNDGSANFSLVVGAPFPNVYNSAIAVADVDGDNDNDVVVSGIDDSNKRYTNLYLNDGSMNFTLDLSAPFTPISNSSLAFVDVDGDNDQDIMIAGLDINNTGITKLYLNDGMGVFTQNVGVTFDAANAGDIVFADVDNDLDQDVLISGINEFGQKKTKLYKNQTYSPGINILLNDTVCSGETFTFPDGNTLALYSDTSYLFTKDGPGSCDTSIFSNVVVRYADFASATLTETCDTTTLFAVGNINSITWSGGIQDGANFTPPLGSTTYYVSGYSQVHNCPVNDSIVISRAKPLDPFSTVNGQTPLGGNPFQYLCGGDVLDLTPFGVSPDGSYDISNTLWTFAGWSAGNPSNYGMYLGVGDSVTNVMVHPFGCYDTLVVKMRQNPSISITTSAVDSVFSPAYAGYVPVVCPGDQISLTASGLSLTGTGPVWLDQPGYFWDNGVVNGQSFVPLSSAVYQVLARDDYQCESIRSIYVEVYAPTILTMDPFSKNPMCLKDNTTLLPSAFPSGGNFYGPGVSNANGSFNPDWAGIGTHSIIYEYTDANGCESQVTEDIEVIESPDFNYSTSDLSVTLTANNLCSNYYWDFGDGNTNSLTTNPAYTYVNPGTYSVCLVCNDISNCVNCINLSFPSFASGIVNGTIGIEEVIESENFSIFPNPNNGRFTLIYDDNIGGADVMLYSISGQLLDSYKLNNSQNSLQVDISNYESGIYFIHLKTTNDVVVKRIVKN